MAESGQNGERNGNQNGRCDQGQPKNEAED